MLLIALSLSQAADPAREVRTVLDAQQLAWNAGKLEPFVNYYDADAQFFSGGAITKGRAAVLARYRKRYQADGKEMGTLTFSEVDVELLTPTDALIRGRWKVAMKSGTPSGLFTLLMRKKAEGWRIVHDHTSAAE